MKLIWLKTKELQSYKVDFSWQSIMGPLVIGSTSYHREYLLSSEAPLIHAIHVPEISQSEGARLSAQPGQILAGNEGV